MTLKLVLGSRNYSSWSLRPWLAMKSAAIPFEETVLPIYLPGARQAILAFSPSGKVPVLLDGGIRVWESFAIIEYVAEKFPAAGLWPQDAAERAYARAIANEMHAGFLPLRRRCPMNMRRPPGAIELTDDVRADVARIEGIWSECRARSAARGAFLFGAFGAADATFAPVVSRFHTYGIVLGAPGRDYMHAVMNLPAWSAWAKAAAVEPWVLPQFEIAGVVEPARGRDQLLSYGETPNR
jgi:glutathione S-transferase